MTLGIVVAVRNSRLDEITAAIDAGTAGKLVFYDGTRPATGGAATNEVATLTLSDPSAPAASSGTLTFSSITGDTNATGGTATWYRLMTSANAAVVDGSVGTSGSDINLDNNVISAGATVNVTSLVFTEGNA